MDDRSRYLWLKLLTILGPTVFVAGGELFRTIYLRHHFSPPVVSAIAVGTTLVGAVVFSWYVFRAIEHIEQERRSYKEALLSLQERERIAREMHDGIAQNLAVLKLEMYKLREGLKRFDQAALMRTSDEIESLINQTYLEVRQTLYDLRASQRLHEGFWPTVERQLAEFERISGVATRFEPLRPPRELWNELASIQILRIIQEALANVRRHAQARQVTLACRLEGHTVRFVVADDGQGFQVDNQGSLGSDHYGLQVMRERAEAIGGHLDVESVPRKGTTVTLTFPVSQRSAENG
ncbi:sensor histidine kinase [Sulfobacillus harzensis]|uniref:histidine kinase n=1 Tax=Sulfobacillus harzensis TaxID=2729629 RepID=A0A7Y0L8U1_9FIRM|nr:sensor histidine kinase [Sulfobacillus harzensis]NMP24024.1 sensor histidine kinase [Sulfobacillus harzensis]